jgi:hypothetical protein
LALGVVVVVVVDRLCILISGSKYMVNISFCNSNTSLDGCVGGTETCGDVIDASIIVVFFERYE